MSNAGPGANLLRNPSGTVESQKWTALKCKTLGAMVVHTVHKGCSSDIRSTRHTWRTCTDNWWVGSRTTAPPCGRAFNFH